MRSKRIHLIGAVAVLLAIASACSPRVASDGVPIRAGPLISTNIDYTFALYYLPVPDQNPLDVLAKVLKSSFTNIQHVSKIAWNTDALTVRSEFLKTAGEKYPPPSLESLTYFGRGLTRKEAVALQGSKSVLLLQFGYKSNHVWLGMKSALELTETLARETKAIIWDDATREAFSLEAWHSNRLDAWTDAVPDISKHITMHAYNKDEYARAITLGMEKFGLPDVLVDSFSWSQSRQMGILINMLIQIIAEDAVITRAGEFDLDLRRIKAAEVREPQLTSLKSKATGIAKLMLHEGKWEEGDPHNRLIAIGFDRYRGRDIHARQEKLLSTMFGWEESVASVRHDDEILAASQKARLKLPGLRAEFDKGLAPGEYIQVKAPFAIPSGGNEWMWVEVTAWQGGKIKGLLKNEPMRIPTLHGGQIVDVDEAKVFDYLRTYPDGREEGNETGPLIQRQSESRR